MSSEPTSPVRDALGDPALRAAVRDFVRKRVPRVDVDDVVQNVFCDALVAEGRPEDPDRLKRWLLGVARHKVADRHRAAARREVLGVPEDAAHPPPLVEAGSLVRWAEEQAGPKEEDARTLGWMAREGEGEKLEAIAAEEKVSAAQVRQRVSRMRRWMRERWAAELAAVAMLAALALAAWWLLRKPEPPVAHDLPGPTPNILPEPPSPLDRARSLRADALRACDRGEWRTCLDGLDQAKGLDPAGDQDAAVGAARATALEALLRQEPAPTSAPLTKQAPVAPTAKTPSTPSFIEEGAKGRTPGKSAPSKAVKKPAPDDPFGGSGTGKPSLKKRAASTVVDSPRFNP